jgi:tyrosine aminotransferase
VHDPTGVMNQIKSGIVNLSQLIIGANSLIQAALPDILATPESFHQDTMKKLEENASLSVTLLANIPGLTVIPAQGAMYLLVCYLNAYLID